MQNQTNPPRQGGQTATWVNASERLPQKEDVYYIKACNKKMLCRFSNGKFISGEEGSLLPHQVIWLEEPDTAQATFECWLNTHFIETHKGLFRKRVELNDLQKRWYTIQELKYEYELMNPPTI